MIIPLQQSYYYNLSAMSVSLVLCFIHKFQMYWQQDNTIPVCGGDIVVYDTSNYFKILTIFLIADHHDDRYAMDDAHMASF